MGQQKLFTSIWLHHFRIGERSEAVNCEGSEQEGEEKWFPFAVYQYMAPFFFALGNKSSGFCEAVNCERSEQEGKFLFAMLVSILWFPPPSKDSWHNARESTESGGTIH